ncbi:ATP-binding protein [Actinomadura sp. 9N215]|uniref:ATP-binding protein n=1 Tax=Actinomadura sp. 9N215 TaxID=3375150 RepID=UPI00379FA66F
MAVVMACGGVRVNAVAARRLEVMFRAARMVPGLVRTLVEVRLVEWGLSGLVDDVSLIVSELVTNAVRYASGREVRVRFAREPHGVVVKVWDASDALPVRGRVLDTAAEVAVPDAAVLEAGHLEGLGGRGLSIVEALAYRCGVSPTEPCGKWVWARVLA